MHDFAGIFCILGCGNAQPTQEPISHTQPRSKRNRSTLKSLVLCVEGVPGYVYLLKTKLRGDNSIKYEIIGSSDTRFQNKITSLPLTISKKNGYVYFSEQTRYPVSDCSGAFSAVVGSLTHYIETEVKSKDRVRYVFSLRAGDSYDTFLHQIEYALFKFADLSLLPEDLSTNCGSEPGYVYLLKRNSNRDGFIKYEIIGSSGTPPQDKIESQQLRFGQEMQSFLEQTRYPVSDCSRALTEVWKNLESYIEEIIIVSNQPSRHVFSLISDDKYRLFLDAIESALFRIAHASFLPDDFLKYCDSEPGNVFLLKRNSTVDGFIKYEIIGSSGTPPRDKIESLQIMIGNTVSSFSEKNRYPVSDCSSALTAIRKNLKHYIKEVIVSKVRWRYVFSLKDADQCNSFLFAIKSALSEFAL